MGVEASRQIETEIDYSWLFSVGKGQEDATGLNSGQFSAGGEYLNTTETEKPPEGFKMAILSNYSKEPEEQPKTLYIIDKLEREAQERSLSVYKQYRENTSRSGKLRAEILKGLKAGEDIYSLFLKAAEAITLMTSNSLFYEQAKADLQSIYGRGLNIKSPLQIELNEATERLKKLVNAEARETEPESKERLIAAIFAHNDLILDLSGKIDIAEQKDQP